MSTYLFLYRHAKDPSYTPGSPETIAESGAFFKAMEPNLEDMGNPIFTHATVGECGEGSELGGYSLVSAESIEEASALAERCWLVQRGGGVEVGEVTRLNPDSLATKVADHPGASSTAA